MADIKDKLYTDLKVDLEQMGSGAEKHKDETEHPLPPNLIKKRYTDAEAALTASWEKAKDLEKQTLEAFDDYQEVYKAQRNLHNKDQRTIKGIFGIRNEELRDFGIQPEKERPGRTPGNGGE